LTSESKLKNPHLHTAVKLAIMNLIWAASRNKKKSLTLWDLRIPAPDQIPYFGIFSLSAFVKTTSSCLADQLIFFYAVQISPSKHLQTCTYSCLWCEMITEE